MTKPAAGPHTPGKAIGWSVAFLASGMLLSVACYTVLDGMLPPSADPLVGVLLQSVAMLLAFGAATWAIGIRGAGLSRHELRWGPAGIGVRGFAAGMLLGAAPAAVALAAAVLVGGAAWSLDGGTFLDWLGTAGRTGAVLLPAALAEEVVFRGVPLVLLAATLGRGQAAVVLSVFFASAHLLNPGITGLAMVNIALAGVFLSACFYLSGGLWTATGAHLGWNLGLAALAAPVSGVPLGMPWLDYAPGSPAWLTGGGFGPEGGILATLVFLAMTILVARRVQQRRPE